MAEVLVPPKKKSDELIKSISIPVEMRIRWAKEYLEDPKSEIHVKRNSIQVLIECGELEYLKKFKGQLEADIGYMKRDLEKLQKERFSFEFKLQSKVSTVIHDQFSDGEWEKMPAKKRDSLIASAWAKQVVPVMREYDKKMADLERDIAGADAMIKDINQASSK